MHRLLSSTRYTAVINRSEKLSISYDNVSISILFSSPSSNETHNSVVSKNVF